jgi:hypothetical protein
LLLQALDKREDKIPGFVGITMKAELTRAA